MANNEQKIWRSSNFDIEEKCIVIKDYCSEHGSFSVGEIVSFAGESYSRYDNSSAYTFQSNNETSLKTLFINDEDAGIEAYIKSLSK